MVRRLHAKPLMLILAKNWWALALRGLLGIALGIFLFARPGAALVALVYVFGVYALLDGVFSVVAALRGARGDRSWWTLLLGGLAGILVGIGAFALPALAALVLLYVIAFWAVVTGVLEVAAAVRLREQIDNEWLLGLSGVLTVLFGVLIMIAPAAGALAVVLLIGAYTFLSGLVLLALGFRLRAEARRPPRHAMRRAA
jgi:uncharacterized membrane protein HdeD (DUF308 family)